MLNTWFKGFKHTGSKRYLEDTRLRPKFVLPLFNVRYSAAYSFDMQL